MSNSQVDTDAVKSLIRAVGEYQDAIHVQKQFLLNAANVCDQVMGSDPISSKKIAKLEEALAVLDYASDKIIEEGLNILSEDLKDLESIVEEA